MTAIANNTAKRRMRRPRGLTAHVFLMLAVVISTVNGLQSFTEPQVLFGSNAANANLGGPGQAGLTTLLYFYQSAFLNNDYGYGAAIVWAFFVLIIILVAVNWRITTRGRKA